MSNDQWPTDPNRGETNALSNFRYAITEFDGVERTTEDSSAVKNTLDFRLREEAEESMEDIDNVSNFLKTNPTIKTLKVDFMRNELTEARSYLLETLGNEAKVGNNLDSLWIVTDYNANKIHATLLGQYLISNRNLTRLDIELEASGPTALHFVSSTLASSTVAHFVSHPRCRALGGTTASRARSKTEDSFVPRS